MVARVASTSLVANSPARCSAQIASSCAAVTRTSLPERVSTTPLSAARPVVSTPFGKTVGSRQEAVGRNDPGGAAPGLTAHCLLPTASCLLPTAAARHRPPAPYHTQGNTLPAPALAAR